MQSGGSSYSGGYSESYNGGWVDSSGASVSSVIVLIIAIFVIWVLLDRMRYTRYQRRIRVGGPVIPYYYPIFWGRPRRRRPAPPPPRGPRGGPRPMGFVRESRKEPSDFEDRMKQFMQASDSKLSELRYIEKKGGNRRSGGGGRR